jgi:hypothetical protein
MNSKSMVLRCLGTENTDGANANTKSAPENNAQEEGSILATVNATATKEWNSTLLTMGTTE